MKIKNILFLLGVCVLVCMITAWFSQRDINVGRSKPMQNFSFMDIQGEHYRLNRFKGKTVLLHVWASWCPPCVREFPSLLKKAKATPNVILIAISIDQDKTQMTKFLAQYKNELREHVIFVWDPEREISQDRLNITEYPETIILNDDLSLRDHIRSGVDWTTFPLM